MPDIFLIQSEGILFYSVFILAGVLIIALIFSSFNRGLGLDNQPLIYLAYLTNKFGMLPYRDFFYFQMPGVHLYYVITGIVFGYSYMSIRIADLAFLAVILILSFFLFRKISLKSCYLWNYAITLYYLFGGEYFSMQRDFVLLIPISAVLFITPFGQKYAKAKFFIIGFCCSISMFIKPHAAIILIVLFVFMLYLYKGKYVKPFSLKNTITALSITLTGFLLPSGVVVYFLWDTNSLYPFWNIMTNFIPLYRKFIYSNSTLFTLMPESNRFIFALNGVLHFGNQRLLFIPAAFGVDISVFRSELTPEQKRIVYLFSALAITFIVYVVIAGMYFSYHWLPFSYCMIFLSSLCFVKTSGPYFRTRFMRILPLIVIYFIFTFRVVQQRNLIYSSLTDGKSFDSIRLGIEEASQYLKSNLKPGDKVLPLDGLGTGLASMLLARAVPADYYITAWYLNIPELP